MTVVAPLAVGASTAQAAPQLDPGEKKTYIVQLDDNPVATYTGGVKGLTATAPATGEKVDADSRAADAYEAHLTAQHEAALARVGLAADAKQYEYTVAFNGFAVELDQVQASQIRKAPGVVNVWEDEIRHADTITTPEYLGMTGEDGVWESQFEGHENAGSGIVVGVIDTGLWPENPSFAPLPGDPAPPEDWAGECETGTETDPARAFECNSKVIGARYYAEENNVIPAEFLSPRDFNGHGSHTAGTAAGNYGVEAEIDGVDVGTMSGMAPAAQIAVYKALWQTEDGNGSGSTAGLVAAINDATSDGVDVINYSISGSSTSIVGPDEIAFLAAADAGIFVATSAGNSGETVGESSVAHNAPWTTTVAASTHDRNVNKTVTVGADDRVERIFGQNRYATAAAVAEEFPEGVDTVYVTTGQAYADALAGSAPASRGMVPNQVGTMNTPDGEPAPVLLVKQDSIPSATADVLETIAPSDIVILGGETAVSTDVEEQLPEGATVSRIGGDNRYETAALLAEQYGEVDRVYVATGEDTEGAFADALSGAALAGSQGYPVLLTHKDFVPNVVADALDSLGDPEVVVLGGPEAVSAEAFDELGGDDRIFGTNRYETSVAIAAEFDHGQDAGVPNVYIATGAEYPDALAGSSLAGHENAPVLLTKDGDVPNAVMAALADMSPEHFDILGGTLAVSQDVEDELDAAFPAPDGATYWGVGVGESVGPAPLVNAEDIPADGVTPAQSRLCLLDSLDPAGADGNIVICTRGENARVEKGQAVADAGGIGMIQANTTDEESLNADFQAVPSIHVNATNGAAIKAYEASAEDPTAFISADGQGEVVAPEMAGFSSYGPALAGGGDLLKPDITAPGVDVIAAVAPPANAGNDFFSYSGTSMSAPHIAGLGALMAQENPDWSPAAIKSAMMTTATPLNRQGEPIERAGEDATPLDYGSGEVRPGQAYGAGLVYDADATDWLMYACSINQLQPIAPPGTCDQVQMDPSDLNYPSIAIGDLVGEQTVTRTVTNVSDASETYTAQVEAPEGTTVEVEPASFTVGAGETATYQVTVGRTTAELEEYTFGAITWVGDAGHEVRSPIAVRPVGVAAPTEVQGAGVTGEMDVDVASGFSGVLTTDVDGLVPSDATDVEVVASNAFLDDGWVDFVIPEDANYFRAAIFDSEVSVEGTDLDLFLVDSEGRVVAQSAVGGSDEAISLEDPAPGQYGLAIDWWDGAEGEELQVPAHLFFVTDEDQGNLTVTPESAPVTTGQELTLNLAWSDLQPGSRYLGAVNYLNGQEQSGRTLVSLVTGAHAPE